jgi:hypothetical protein
VKTQEEREERRDYERAVQEARRAERQSASPTKKVAMKLERRRLAEAIFRGCCEDPTGAAAAANPLSPSSSCGSFSGARRRGQVAPVPMQSMKYLSSKGWEQVTLVDVGTLRARCEHLTEGGGPHATLHSLLEKRRHLDRRREGGTSKSRRQVGLCCSMPALHSAAGIDVSLGNDRSAPAATAHL